MNEDNDQQSQNSAQPTTTESEAVEASNPTPDTTVNPETDSEPTPSDTAFQQSVVSGGGSRKKKKILLGLLILLLIAGLGYASWKLTTQEPATVTKTQAVKQPVTLIRVGEIEGSVNTFYPSIDGVNSTSYRVNNQIFEGLVKYQDVSKITPLLATSWTNPDDSTWVFNLKPGVKFHNGNRMTAADVKYSLEKFNADAYGGIFAIDAKEITVVSDNKIKVVTTDPDPLLLNKLAYLAVVDSRSDKEADPESGTGPYTVKKGTTPTESDLDLVAFNQYHGGTPLTKEVTWKYYASEDDLVKDTLAGKIDYTTGIDTQKNIDQVGEQTKLKTASDTGLGVSSLGINTNKTNSPLKNLKFRQAVAIALDRQAIITDANLKAEPAEQVVTKDVPGYNEAIKMPKPDVNTAKKLLAESGYPNGATFYLTYDKGSAQDQADSITKQLKQINVTVKQDPFTDFDAMVDKVFSGNADTYFLSYTTDLFDSSDALATLFQNPNYDKTELNDLLDKAAITIDPVKRLTDLKNASKLVIDDVGEVPVYSLDYNVTYSQDLNITRDTYYTTYFWQTYKKD